jgi:transposase-like protein
MRKHKVAPEIREQIVSRIKDGSVTVQQAAKEHGIHETTVYGWLGAKVESAPSILEFAKLKRERDELLRLVGEITLKLSESQKKK